MPLGLILAEGDKAIGLNKPICSSSITASQQYFSLENGWIAGGVTGTTARREQSGKLLLLLLYVAVVVVVVVVVVSYNKLKIFIIGSGRGGYRDCYTLRTIPLLFQNQMLFCL